LYKHRILHDKIATQICPKKEKKKKREKERERERERERNKICS
jgi:hypothetical protein